MPRTAGKRDGNHDEIRQALRRIGCYVFDTADLGRGFPDLVVGIGDMTAAGRGVTVLLEVKDPKRKRLTPDEQSFHFAWCGGPLHIVTTAEEAMKAVRAALLRRGGRR